MTLERKFLIRSLHNIGEKIHELVFEEDAAAFGGYEYRDYETFDEIMGLLTGLESVIDELRTITGDLEDSE